MFTVLHCSTPCVPYDCDGAREWEIKEKGSTERCEGDGERESNVAITRRESESDENEIKRMKAREIKAEAIKLIMEKMNGRECDVREGTSMREE